MSSPVEQVTKASCGPPIDEHGGHPTRGGRRRLAHYLAAALAARTADEGARVALLVLAVERTGSVAVGGTLVATLLIPHVIAAPLIGSLVDRARRPGLVLAAAVTVVAAGLAAAVLLLGRAPLVWSYVVLAMAGCCGPAITGGLTSRLPGLVRGPQQGRAFGLDSLFYNLAGMAGPALVAAAAACSGPTAATLLLASVAALGALGIATLRLPTADPAADGGRTGLLDGVRAIVGTPRLRSLIVTTGLGQLGPGGLAVVATVLAASLQRQAIGGLLLSVVALGGLLGSLLWTWRPLPAVRAGEVTAWSMIGIGLPLAGAAATDSMPVIMVLFGLSGFFVGPFTAALFLARNELAPAPVRGQVFTIGAGLKVAAAALGAALLGYAGQLPVSAQLMLVAASPVVAGILGLIGTRPRSGGSSPPAGAGS